METASLPQSIVVLSGTAASLGLLHTLFGPDHYLPFVALARAGRWSLSKTVVVTLLCGAAHVLSSVVLGLVGIAVGIAVFKLERIEAWRGDIAGWLLLAFGLAYLVWGVRQAVRNRPHTHLHVHADGSVHSHEHVHAAEHSHVHAAPYAGDAAPPTGRDSAGRTTPWILFLIFVFGPCEPLIPMVMYPAAQGSFFGVVLVTVLFGLTTLATMTTIVVLACLGATRFSLGRFQRYGHALAGLLVVACGAAVLLGL